MRGRQQILALFERLDCHDRKIPLAELMRELRSLVIKATDLADVTAFDDEAYLRIVLRGHPHYQAMLLCWKSGQSSPIHDHRGSNCAVRVVSGRATETRFSVAPCGQIRPVSSDVHGPGDVTGCSGNGIHQMANLERTGTDLITLHIYSPPPSGWRAYRICDTTLADGDRLISTPARTVRTDLGHESPTQPMGSKSRRATPWPR